MGKGKGLLSKGLFNKSFMDSKITTRTVTKKEKILGHLIGPLGLILVVNTIAALVEKFFTQQCGTIFGIDNVDAIKGMGGVYEWVMTGIKIAGIFMGLLIGVLVQKTQSRQGRFRPWHLLFGFLAIAFGALLFLFPGGNNMGDGYWVYFFFMLVCYNVIGSSFFFIFRDNIVSVSTRDPGEKAQLKFIRQICWTIISGILIGMLISMVAMPMWLEKDIKGYPLLILILSIVAIPLLLLEYFYTKERIVEDLAKEEGIDKENNVPLKAQLKALLSNRYYMLLILLTTAMGIVDNFKGGNVQYFYIKFLLGGETNYSMYTIYQVVTGIPLGIGAIAIWPLAKKFGIKNVSLVGYALALVGGIVGIIMPSNLPVALVAGFIKQLGMLPNAFVFGTLLYYAFDDIEFRSHLRLEGLFGVALIGAIQSAIYAPFAGGYEATLLKMGFVDLDGVTASEEVKNFMSISFYLFDIVADAIFVIVLPFVNVEKKLPEINKELINRQKEAALAKGEEWVEPEEQKRREAEELAKQHEEDRIADLKDRCQKKGLDFETENNKYLALKAEKERKAKEKEEKKKAKLAKKKK
jgi:GPH family glycoside/pentoside/hexuronide:cation symporter